MEPFSFEVENAICDTEGRYVPVVGKINGEYGMLLNVYNPLKEGPSATDLAVVQSKAPKGCTFDGEIF